MWNVLKNRGDLGSLTRKFNPNSSWTVALLLAVLSLVVYSFLANTTGIVQSPTTSGAIFCALILVLGFGFTWSNTPFAFYALAQSVNFNVTLYIAFSWSGYDIGAGDSVLNSPLIPVIFGAVAVLRPVFLIVPGLILQWVKTQLSLTVGAPLGGTADYVIIPDMALLVGVFFAIFGAYRWSEAKLANAPITNIVESQYFLICTVFAAAVHFSNYFYSGVSKLTLGNADAFTWVQENPTYMLLIHTTDFGMLTVGSLLGSYDSLVPYLQRANIPLNAIVLASQLASLVILISIRASALLTALYDIMHLVIFALTAIFFWKWIVLNIGFILAFRAILRNCMVIPLTIRLLGCVILVAAPLMPFHIVRLAWFDTGAVNETRYEALLKNGETVEVPTNFFLEKSIRVAQHRYEVPFTGFLPTGTWGTTADAEILRETKANCRNLRREWDLSDDVKRWLAGFVRDHHRQALSMAKENGTLDYDLFPHHIWSSPDRFSDFASTDLRQVASYSFVVESRCVSVGVDGRVVSEPVGVHRYAIELHP